jgi:hypothetical protein
VASGPRCVALLPAFSNLTLNPGRSFRRPGISLAIGLGPVDSTSACRRLRCRVDSDIPSIIDLSLQGLRLLGHPFDRRWQDDQIGNNELTDYAEQYRHFERCLPGVLSKVTRYLPQGENRQLVESNLHDELSCPRPTSTCSNSSLRRSAQRRMRHQAPRSEI